MSIRLRLLLAFLLSAAGTILLAFLLSGIFPIAPWLLGILLSPVGLGGFIVSYNMMGPSNLRIESRASRLALKAHPEYAEMFKEASASLEQMEAMRKRERSPEVRRQISSLHDTSLRIMDHLAKYPDQISQARRFFSYYLSTAMKILEQRERFKASGLRNDEIRDGIRVAEETLPRLNQAFEGQLTNLLNGQLMDLEAESKLLETAVRMDGLPADEASEALPEDHRK